MELTAISQLSHLHASLIHMSQYLSKLGCVCIRTLYVYHISHKEDLQLSIIFTETPDLLSNRFLYILALQNSGCCITVSRVDQRSDNIFMISAAAEYATNL